MDLRRLTVTALAETVRTFPAGEVLALSGFGRDRLTAVVTGLPPVDDITLRGHLRHPEERPGG